MKVYHIQYSTKTHYGAFVGTYKTGAQARQALRLQVGSDVTMDSYWIESL